MICVCDRANSLIDVKIININLTSFNEIGEETEFDEVLFRRRILEIIDQRGKLHNPITGTGGMLYGRVLKMDPQYENHYGLQVGDEIISLTSLSVTPMRLDRILSVDFQNAHLTVEGQCILFSDSPLIKMPSDLPNKTVISALDEAGAPTKAYSLFSRAIKCSSSAPAEKKRRTGGLCRPQKTAGQRLHCGACAAALPP